MLPSDSYPRLTRQESRRLRPCLPGLLGRLAGAACLAVTAATGVAVQALAAPVHASAPAQVLDVTTLSDSGTGSLRSAVQAADASAPGQPTTIDFAVAGTITLASALPTVSRIVTVDGTSAPGYVSGGPPVLEIDCDGQPGLQFAAGSAGSQLLGVAVDDAGGNGVTLDAGSVTLNHDYIGLDLAGNALGNDGDGIYASSASSRNVIGMNTSGDSGAVANVISGNSGSGIVLSGSSDNVVAANRIGTNAAGGASIGNGGNGVWITAGSDGNEIGGTDFVDAATGQANNPTGSKGTVTPVFVVPPQGNLISGNAENGVLINAGSRDNTLNGNFVGTTADGDAALGNAGEGVWIDRAGHNSLTGCKFVNNPFVYYNVVSGNGRSGLRITNSDGTLVQGNFFGVGANNTAIVGNRTDGILVGGSSSNTQVGGVIPLGNVAAGNGTNGIAVTGTASGFTTFNTFGGLLAFKGAAPNGNDGLLITSTGGGNLARTNVFSGNAKNGIELAGDSSGVTIDPDIAGLTTNGGAVLPNGGDGVRIDGTAHGNVVGGSLRSVIPQDTFSGNVGYGLAITGNAHDNQVFGSFIGTDVLGLTALANQAGGVLIGDGAYANSVGDFNSTPADLISGNIGNGVTLGPGTREDEVLNNYIGLDRLARSLPNTGRPVVDHGVDNTILGNRTRP
jgi:parallel beta-helix repeat protein